MEAKPGSGLKNWGRKNGSNPNVHGRSLFSTHFSWRIHFHRRERIGSRFSTSPKIHYLLSGVEAPPDVTKVSLERFQKCRSHVIQDAGLCAPLMTAA